MNIVSAEDRSWTPEQAELIRVDAAGVPEVKSVSVTADAGSGKTATLTKRVSDFISANSEFFKKTQKRILCVSFTEKSAADLSERLSSLNEVDVYTIHGFCARVVTEFGDKLGLSPVVSIIDAEADLKLFHECFKTVFMRTPLDLSIHGTDTYYDLCKLFKSIGEIKAFDCSSNGDDLDQKKIRRFCEDVVNEYELQKRKLGLLEYSDLENFAQKLLSERRVSSVLQKRYKHVFVDEFQDTNELQCDIVKSLISKEGYLFVVGDIKQSIYRFRGADVEVFKRFSAELERKKLSVNFRSDPQIITAINSVCGPVIDGYEDMRAGKASVQTKGLKDKVIRVICDTDEEGVHAVVKYLESQAVDPSKCVLLMRALKNKTKFLESLKKRGIVFTFGGGSAGQISEEMLRLIYLWIWANDPGSKVKLANAVMSFPDYFMKGLAMPDLADVRTALPLILSTDWLVRCLFLSDRIVIDDPEMMLSRLNNEFGLNQIFGTTFVEFSLYIAQEKSKGSRSSVIAYDLSLFMNEDQMIPGMIQLPPPPELEGAIRVMTVHSSKGLEFPYVILAGLKGSPPRGKAFISGGKNVALASRDEDGKLSKNDFFKAINMSETEANEAESARLLYVAMTRAETGLFLISREDDEVKEGTWEAWIRDGVKTRMTASELLNIAESKGYRGSLPLSKDIPLSQDPLFENEPQYLKARIGASTLNEKVVKTDTPEKRPEKNTTEKNTTGNKSEQSSAIDFSATGTVVHELLEREDFDTLWSLDGKNGLKLSGFKKWISDPQSCAQTIFKKLKHDDDNQVRILREYAFDWSTPQGVVAGRLDKLVVFERKNECWIIDYKVMFAKKSADDFTKTYSAQLYIYRDAIRALSGYEKVRCFLVDVNSQTGSVWHEVL